MFKRLTRLFWQAYRLWDRQDCVDLGAAFAYHSLQALFPILLIALGVASRILGQVEGLTDNLLMLAQQVLPATVLPLLSSTLIKLERQGTGAGVVGALLLVLTATNAYLSLRRGADRLWGFTGTSSTSGWPAWPQVLKFLRSRLESLALVVLIGMVVALDQLTTNLRLLRPGGWRELLEHWLPASARLWIPLPLLLDLGLSLLLACSLAYGLLAVLPSRRVPRRPLIPGALLIGSTLTVLNLGLGRSLLSLSNRFQAYGVIGAVLLLSLWVWLVAVITYYGMAVSVILSRRSWGGRSAPVSVALQRPPG